MASRSPPQSWEYLLTKEELLWRNHYVWLKEHDYLLRPRYNPDWVPSQWIAGKELSELGFDLRFEDSQANANYKVMDATRISDGAFVVLKPINIAMYEEEIPIGLWFSEEPQASDPANHCVPILEVLDFPDVPGKRIIVMPQLCRYDKPRFDTVGEAVEFMRQVFQGLQFMHKNNIVHRDCNAENIMMDVTRLFPTPYHPLDTRMKRDWSGRVSHLTRTQRPVKYYLIDFGLSVRYAPGAHRPPEPIVLGGDRSAPEFRMKDGVLPMECDPFPTDIYYIGNLLRTDFVEGRGYGPRPPKLGFEFLRPLMEDMVQDDPALRPTMDEVVRRFDEIIRGLSRRKLRSRVVKVDDDFDCFYAVTHWFRMIASIIRRREPIPSP